jgi:hypothetical protein
MKIILISGKQGSGKTTLQKELYSTIERDGSALTMNFADALYEMHDAVLKVLHKYMDPRPIVKDGPLLQLLGTQWGRETIDQDIWVKLMRKRVNKVGQSITHVIVGDCRFENEFDAFPEALRVRLYCPEAVRKARCSMWRDNTEHASETGLDQYYLKNKFDLVLNTEKSDQKDDVQEVIEMLKTDWVNDRP